MKKLSKKLSKKEVVAAEKDFKDVIKEDEDDKDIIDDSSSDYSSSDSEDQPVQKRTTKKSKVELDIPDLNEWKNKQRVMTVCNRGTGMSYRHLLNDLRNLLPHSKKDVKMDNSDLKAVAELAEYQSCNNVIFFETVKKKDCFMYVGKVPEGPTAKFLLSNIHTSAELKLTGNCLKGSRPLLLFDEAFDRATHLKLFKEMFIHSFGTPKFQKKSKPFVDHIFSFFIQDNKIWFRNYQISGGATAAPNLSTTQSLASSGLSLVEIGPRFVMTPVSIFKKCMSGKILYQNPEWAAIREFRVRAKEEVLNEKLSHQLDKAESKKRKKKILVPEEDEFENLFE